MDALLKGVARREFDIVAAWSVCRLRRSLTDLLGKKSVIRTRCSSAPTGLARWRLMPLLGLTLVCYGPIVLREREKLLCSPAFRRS